MDADLRGGEGSRCPTRRYWPIPVSETRHRRRCLGRWRTDVHRRLGPQASTATRGSPVDPERASGLSWTAFGSRCDEPCEISPLKPLMAIPGAVRPRTSDPGALGHSRRAGCPSRPSTDRLGNLIATIPRTARCPSVHAVLRPYGPAWFCRPASMEEDGTLRLHRLGGVPEARASEPGGCSQRLGGGPDILGVITNKSHHVTRNRPRKPKCHGVPGPILPSIAALPAGAEARCGGGRRSARPSPTRRRAFFDLGGHRRVAGTVHRRSGRVCAVAARDLAQSAGGTGKRGPTVHMVFSVQEEFNLRGAQVAAGAKPAGPTSRIQIDLMIATDTPETARSRARWRLGRGAGHVSLLIPSMVGARSTA